MGTIRRPKSSLPIFTLVILLTLGGFIHFDKAHIATPATRNAITPSMSGDTQLGFDCGLGTTAAVLNGTGFPVAPTEVGTSEILPRCVWTGDAGIVAGGTSDKTFEPLVTDQDEILSSAIPNVGGGFTADVVYLQNATSATNGFDITVNWNPSVLQLAKVDQGGLPWKALGPFTQQITIDNTIGQVHVVQVIFVHAAGDIVLFRMRFDVIGVGTSPLTINNDIMTNPGAVVHTRTNGSFDSEAVYDTFPKTLNWNANFSETGPATPGGSTTFVAKADCPGCTTPLAFAWQFDSSNTIPFTSEATGSSVTVTLPSTSIDTRIDLRIMDAASHSIDVVQNIRLTTAPTFTVTLTCPPNGSAGTAVSCAASAAGGTSPYTYSWNFGDGFSGAGSSTTHTYSSPGSYTIVVTVKDSSSPTQTINSQQRIIVTSPPPSRYTASWQGYDWDGGHEETVYLNGIAAASLPPTDVGSNGGTWASFSLNITSFLVQGTNLLTFAHAGWDCNITDNVGNLLITSGSNILYSNSASLPLSCAQSLTYTFTIGTAPPPPPPPPLTLTESFDTANAVVGETCSFRSLASGGVPPYSFSWDFGDGGSGFGTSITHIYTAPGTYAVTLTVRDSASTSSNILTVTGYQIISAKPVPSAGTYTLSWEGYDWDGGGEETISLNGKIITSLPAIDTSSEGGAWAPFFLNVTSYVMNGTNTLVFTHANWDCTISDNVRNLQITSGTTVTYSNPNESPLSCSQTLTYTFTV